MNSKNRIIGNSDEIIDSPNNYESIEEVSEHIIDVILSYCSENILIGSNGGRIISRYEYMSDITWARREFKGIIRNRINQRIVNFFKSGLHQEQESHPIEVRLLIPRNSSLQRMDSSELCGVIRFGIKTHLKPRYIKDGDSGFYEFIFDVEIEDIPDLDNWRVYVSGLNSARLDSGNRSYKVSFIYPNKTKPQTAIRDASIERSRNAYRENLMKVLRLERKKWQTK